MELTLAFLATGISIILYTIWRARRLGMYSKLKNNLSSEYDIASLDNTGDTTYTNCTSHRWVMDNLGRKKHSRLGNIFQERLFENTLTTFIWLSFFLGSGALIFGLLLIRSIEIVGMSVFVIFVGVLVILGPGDAKVSEELLIELISHEIQDLCEKDYVYAQLALDSIRKWIITAIAIGIAVVIISPWAESIPVGLAVGVAILSDIVLWRPALFLSELFFPLSILYLSAVIPFIGYSIIVITRRFRRGDKDSNESSIKW